MDQTNQQPAYSVDYLNQIAPKPPKRFQFNQTQMMIFGGAALVLLIILLITLINIVNGPNKPLERLTARLESTEKTVGDSHSKIKNTELRSLNSNLKIYLTNANRDITPLLPKERINGKKLNSSIVKKESNTEINLRLEDARLNAIFDRTYAREMAYQLEVTIALIRQIYNSSSNSALKEFLNTTLNSLVPVQKSLQDFKDAGS